MMTTNNVAVGIYLYPSLVINEQMMLDKCVSRIRYLFVLLKDFAFAVATQGKYLFFHYILIIDGERVHLQLIYNINSTVSMPMHKYFNMSSQTYIRKCE